MIFVLEVFKHQEGVIFGRRGSLQKSFFKIKNRDFNPINYAIYHFKGIKKRNILVLIRSKNILLDRS